MRLQDRIVLMSSARNPCARSIALRFAREGADCAVFDDDLDSAEELAAAIRALGRRALALRCDVTKKSNVEQSVERAMAEFGRIDILVNCSGIAIAGDFLGFTEEAFNRCLDRGPKAYFLLAQAAGKRMAAQHAGKIINLSTTDARLGSGESAGNSAAYSSIDAMTRAMAQALGFYGVNVNALVCGPMDACSGSAEEAGERLRRVPLGRLGSPEDVAGAAIFLASDDSNFIAGESLYVDAGYSNAAVTEDGFRPEWGRTWGKFEIPPRGQ